MGKKSKARISFLVIFLGCFLVVFLSTLVLMGSLVSAADELYLNGVVQSVDVKSGTIVVDVKSQSCPGLRRFSVGNAAGLEGLEGEKVSFSINGSNCRSGAMYKIISTIRHGG